MNQVLPERRARARTRATGAVELLAGETPIAAELVDVSFVGMRCRVPAGTKHDLPGRVDAVRLQGLPSVSVTASWIEEDMFAATFDVPQKAGRVIAAFLELYTPHNY